MYLHRSEVPCGVVVSVWRHRLGVAAVGSTSVTDKRYVPTKVLVLM